MTPKKDTGGKEKADREAASLYLHFTGQLRMTFGSLWEESRAVVLRKVDEIHHRMTIVARSSVSFIGMLSPT